MKHALLVGALVLGMLPAAAMAERHGGGGRDWHDGGRGHSSFGFSIGIGDSFGFGYSRGYYPRSYYYDSYYCPPPAVVYAPPPVVYSRPSVVYVDPPVSYCPPPVVYAPPPRVVYRSYDDCSP